MPGKVKPSRSEKYIIQEMDKMRSESEGFRNIQEQQRHMSHFREVNLSNLAPTLTIYAPGVGIIQRKGAC